MHARFRLVCVLVCLRACVCCAHFRAGETQWQGRRVARAVLPGSAALGLVGHSALPVARRRIISTVIVIIGTVIVIIGTLSTM